MHAKRQKWASSPNIVNNALEKCYLNVTLGEAFSRHLNGVSTMRYSRCMDWMFALTFFRCPLSISNTSDKTKVVLTLSHLRVENGSPGAILLTIFVMSLYTSRDHFLMPFEIYNVERTSISWSDTNDSPTTSHTSTQLDANHGSTIHSNIHSIQTRSKFGIVKKKVYVAKVSSSNNFLDEPTSFTQA